MGLVSNFHHNPFTVKQPDTNHINSFIFEIYTPHLSIDFCTFSLIIIVSITSSLKSIQKFLILPVNDKIKKKA